jgi:thioredoxin-related protein
MKIRNILIVALGIMLAAGLYACSKKKAEEKPAGPGINWMEFDAGMAKAKQDGKPIMVDFYTTWCKYCKLLEETTYKDPEIVSILNKNFICIKVDAESQDKVTDMGKQMTKAELAGVYKVQGYPTIWFLNDKGEKIGPVPGYSGPEDFKPVLTFISGGAYAKGMKYQDYLDSLKKPETGKK